MRRGGASLAIPMFLLLVAPAAAQPAPAAAAAPQPSPKEVQSLAYDARLLASAAQAERFQGPLDGGWTLAADGAGDLYSFQLVDKRTGLEGAWRDLSRAGAAGSGPIDSIARQPSELQIAFATPDGPARLSLRPQGGALRGELDQAGKKLPVTMRRSDPLPQREVARTAAGE